MSGALSIFGNRITAFTTEAKAELAGLMRVGQVTTATSSTIFESTDLIGQDDDAFNGWYVSVLQADNAAPEGELKPMSDYESATGKVTHTAFTQLRRRRLVAQLRRRRLVTQLRRRWLVAQLRRRPRGQC